MSIVGGADEKEGRTMGRDVEKLDVGRLKSLFMFMFMFIGRSNGGKDKGTLLFSFLPLFALLHH